jgi:hypothetical protein
MRVARIFLHGQERTANLLSPALREPSKQGLFR